MIKRFLSLTALTLASHPWVARAAETAVEHDEDHGSGGLPQFDTSTYPSQIFWLIVTFAALYWLVSNKVAPKVTETLENRAKLRQEDLDTAARLRGEAETLYVEYQSQLATATERARAEVASSKEAIEVEIASKTKALDSELGAMVGDALSDIRRSADEALANVDQVAVEVAQAAVARLIGEKVTKTDAKKALQAVRKEAA